MNKAFEKILDSLEERKQLHERMISYEHENGTITEEYQARKAVDVLNDAKKIVQEVAEEYKDGWIACSERLPEKNGMYLCAQNTYDLATNKNIIRVSTELVEFYNGKWRRAKNLVITHWQPLPEPFKERD